MEKKYQTVTISQQATYFTTFYSILDLADQAHEGST
jgi:hypothetical protein